MTDKARLTSVKSIERFLENAGIACATGEPRKYLWQAYTRLLWRDIMPSLYVLVRNHQPVNDLSADSNNDPTYHTLAELQSHLLIDRGPYLVRKSGVPYLSREGYPYHSVHHVHRDIVRASSKISRRRPRFLSRDI